MSERRTHFDTAYPGVSQAWREIASLSVVHGIREGRAAQRADRAALRAASLAFRVGFLAGGRYVSLLRDGLGRQVAANVAVEDAVSSLQLLLEAPVPLRARTRSGAGDGSSLRTGSEESA